MAHQTRSCVALYLTAFVTTIWGPPAPGTDLDLYGATGTELLRINPNSGGATVITQLGGICCSDFKLVGMDFDRSGRLYGIASSGSLGVLVTIDP
jgi:hypothetical protein